MSNPAKAPSQPTVILFGLSAIGKPRAGTFKGSDVAAARKAAAKLGLTVIEIADPAGVAVAARIPAGRIGGSAETIVPFINKELHAQIKAFAGQPPKNGETTLIAESPRLPASWDDIKVGDMVLAQEADPADGWWQVTIVEVNGDVFKLRWPGSGRGRPPQKHRSTLGLICPPGHEPKPDSKQSTGKWAPVYPANWSSITVDQTVLAPEDGPFQQFWEAKIIKADKDQFTLQWRDYPKLPQIVRLRSALGLMHPAPTVR
jgi:hypothetical protein